MTARDQANELKQQAIDLLLKEREAIEEAMKALGYGQENRAMAKRRGRPPKVTLDNGQSEGHQTEYRPEAESDLRNV